MRGKVVVHRIDRIRYIERLPLDDLFKFVPERKTELAQ